MSLSLHASSTTPAKTAHYTNNISSVLISGNWGEKTPFQDPKGTALDWKEGVRKWSKHTGGSPILLKSLLSLSLFYLSTTSHPYTFPSSSVNDHSSSPQSTASAPSSDRSDPSTARSGGSAETDGSFVHVPSGTDREQNGGGRRSMAEFREKEVGVGKEKEKERHSVDTPRYSTQQTQGLAQQMKFGDSVEYLSKRDLDGDDDEISALREGRQCWVGVANERREEVEGDLKAVEGVLNGKLGMTEKRTAMLLRAYHLHALGRHQAALTAYSELDWSGPSDQQGGLTIQAQVVDMMRGRCLQGLSYELSDSPRTDLAVEAYEKVLSALSSIPGVAVPNSSFLYPQSAAHQASSTFDSHREAYRWISKALCRGAILTGRTGDIDPCLRFLRTYHLLSRSWPGSFRPRQQQLMLNLYMRALYASYPPSRSAVPEKGYKWFLTGKEETVVGTSAEIWSREMRGVLGHGKELLSATTSFPRAGDVNVPVETFVNGCVVLWEKAGGRLREGLDVVRILWWAMTLTFHSQPLLRHLTRLLQATDSPADAKRTFELYVQLVLKARQTSQPDITLQLKRQPTEESPTAPAQMAKALVSAAQGSPPHSAEVVQDSDEDFIEALLVGIRLLTKDLGDASEAWRYAVLAGEVIEQASGRIGMKLKAQVEVSKGIVRVAMAIQDMDPDTRAKWQAQGIDHLIAATLMDPTNASIYYHLAYARAEARDIEQATFSIGSSLELDPGNVEAWHLLALLRTAQKDWDGALKAIGVGIQTWEADEEEEVTSQAAGSAAINERDFAAINERDFAATPTDTTPIASVRTSATKPLIDGHILTPFLTSHNSFTPPLSPGSRLSIVIQLKMTEAVIIEKLFGPDQALQKQQESFAFFSARSGYSRSGSEGSVAGKSTKDLGASFVAVIDQPAEGSGSTAMDSSMISVAPPPLTPAHQPPSAAASDDTPPRSAAASEAEADAEAEAESRETVRRGQKFLPKHLRVPGAHRVRRSGSLGMRSRSPGGEPTEKSIHRTRTISDGSSIFSRTATPAHSHYHGARTPPAAPPPQQPASVPTGRTKEETRVLSNLWLMSAATFRRSGQMLQCLVAIQEAELMDPGNADVWVQLGLYHTEQREYQSAIESFAKSLIMKPDYPSAVINLSIVYFTLDQIDMAHGLLNGLTQANGWDVPEAFLWLARVCERQERKVRAQELLRYALVLERTRCCRELGKVVGRWL